MIYVGLVRPPDGSNFGDAHSIASASRRACNSPRVMSGCDETHVRTNCSCGSSANVFVPPIAPGATLPPLHQLDRAALAHREAFGRLTSRKTRLYLVNDPLPKVR
jgi:hypothetical protein